MLTPLEKLRELLHGYDMNRGKTELRIMINKLMEYEEQVISDAANHGRNRYINEQLKDKLNDKSYNFGKEYYSELFGTKKRDN